MISCDSKQQPYLRFKRQIYSDNRIDTCLYFAYAVYVCSCAVHGLKSYNVNNISIKWNGVSFTRPIKIQSDLFGLTKPTI